MRDQMFSRETTIELPPEINLWVAVTSLLDRLDQSLREVRGRRHGRRQARIWATDGSTVARRDVEDAYSAMKGSGLTPEWCSVTDAVGPLGAVRGRYEVTGSSYSSGTFYLRVKVSSVQKLNADALAATVSAFEKDLLADPTQLSAAELARKADERASRQKVRTWVSVHGTNLGINLLSAIVGGVVATLVLVFVFGIR